MGESNTAQRGGLFRGVLAGLIVVFIIFCTLSYIYPLKNLFTELSAPDAAISAAPVMVAINVQEPSQQETFGAISLPSDSFSPVQFGTSPSPFQSAEADVSITPAPTVAPVSASSTLAAAPNAEGTSFGLTEEKPPVVEMPETPVVEAPTIEETPSVEETVEVPDVVTSSNTTVTVDTQIAVAQPAPAVEDSAVTADVDSSALDKPTGGFSLSGQSIIQPDETQEPSGVENTSSTTSFASYKAVFADDQGLPLLSFILLVESLSEVAEVALLPAPVTLAVSPSNPNAAEIIAAHRENDGEVILLLPADTPDALHNGGDPTQIAARLDAILMNMNGVIGVLDGPDGDLIEDQRMLTTLIAELDKTGHALVTVDGVGRNRANIMAAQAELPATSISQSMIGGMDKVAIIRQLDKTILGIGDIPSITVYADSVADFVPALKFWLKSMRAKQVTVAPVSASILRAN